MTLALVPDTDTPAAPTAAPSPSAPAQRFGLATAYLGSRVLRANRNKCNDTRVRVDELALVLAVTMNLQRAFATRCEELEGALAQIAALNEQLNKYEPQTERTLALVEDDVVRAEMCVPEDLETS